MPLKIIVCGVFWAVKARGISFGSRAQKAAEIWSKENS